MELTLTIKCPKCGVTEDAPIKKNNEGDYILADSIESATINFHCHQGHPDAITIHCICGNEIELNL